MSRKSRIIIVGSGIVGASTAYHLAQLGWKDMVILDQGPLFETGGSTSHAPGGVFQTNPSRMMCKFAQYTVDLLRSLSFEGKPCFHTVGGIEVSKTKERHEDLYRKLGIAHSYGLTDAKIISPDEVLKMSPFIDPEKILVAESGLKTHLDLQWLKENGIINFLIGESLMKEKDLTLATKKILGIKI